MTQPGDKERRFEPVDNLSLNSQSCFVLSRKGMLFARAASRWRRRCGRMPRQTATPAIRAQQRNGLARVGTRSGASCVLRGNC